MEALKTFPHRQSLPPYFHIDNSNQIELFPAVVKKPKKINKATRGAKVTEKELTFLSPKSFEVLQIRESSDSTKKKIDFEFLVKIYILG